MGKRGPKPKPTVLRLLQGNPGRRHIEPNEPKPFPPPKKILPPAHLDQAAKLHWHKMVKLLSPIGLFTTVDRDSLAVYCSSYSRWAMAEKKIATLGQIDAFGNPSGWIKIADRAMDRMHQLWKCFGLSPADRVGLKIEPGESKEDEFDKMLNRSA